MKISNKSVVPPESSVPPMAAALQPPRLTNRERRVMELVSQALTNKQIAASLCVSPSTIKNHVHSILKKVGVRSRTVVCHFAASFSGNGTDGNI
jgi:DNA-binding NarL/FixJ family response regulator